MSHLDSGLTETLPRASVPTSEPDAHDLRLAVREALGAFGECQWHLEHWQARKQAARENLERLQASLAAADAADRQAQGGE